jgi:hypothetical protein
MKRVAPEAQAAAVPDGADAKELNPSGLWMLASARPGALYLEEQLARLPHQFSNVRAFRNSLASIAPMLKRVLVASRGA